MKLLTNILGFLAGAAVILGMVSFAPNAFAAITQVPKSNITTAFYQLFHGTTTDALPEGLSNLYFTNTRADARFVTDLAATTSVKSITTLPSLAGLTTSNFTSANISQWTNNSNYITLSSVSATYPVVDTAGVFSVAFGTSSANTWGSTQTFANAIKNGSLSGLIAGNSGQTYGISTSSLNASITGSAGSVANSLSSNSSLAGTSFNGSVGVSNWGINLANGNIYTALQQFNGNASSSQESATKAYFGGTATTTIDAAGNIVIPSGSGLTITGKSDGCATFATGVLNSTGSVCGGGSGVTSVGLSLPTGFSVTNSPVTTTGTLTATLATGYSIKELPTYVVAAAGGDFTTIQGALDACGSTGGGSIYLTDTNYNQAGTGLLFKGSNCNVYGKSYGTTTINFTGATTGFKTNSAVGIYNHDGIHNVRILGDGTAGSIAVDMSDLELGVYEGLVIDNWDTMWRLNDTQNITFYNKIREVHATTIKSFGINASSTKPANDNTFENVFIGCSSNTTNGCIGINLNNNQANHFDSVTVEPAGNVKTQCVQIRSSSLATNNGTFQNEFNHFYCEGNTRGVYASSTDNRAGSAPVFGNNFYGGQIETNTTNTLCEDAGCKEVGFYGTGINFTNVNQTGVWTILAKNVGTMLALSDQGFSNMALFIQNTTNFAHNSLDYVKIALLNTTDTSNLLNLSNAGAGATIIATSTRGTDFILTGGKVGIGSTTPFSTLAIISGSSVPFIISTTTGVSIFSIDASGHSIYGGYAPTVASCGTSPAIVAPSNDRNGQVKVGTGAVASCTLTFQRSWTTAPHCSLNLSIGKATTTTVYASTTPTTLVVFPSASTVGGAYIDWQCEGSQ